MRQNEEFQGVGIYIHIPFCLGKCNYCDFLSGPVGKAKRAAYVNQLALELEALCDLMKEKGEWIRTIYFGGGTPSILKGDQIGKILGVLKASGLIRHPDCEITLEMNPGTAKLEKLKDYHEAGINRLSMGMQSFHDRELKLLGRPHTVEEGIDAYYMAREAGFTNISIDLMACLPGQTLEDYAYSLRKLLELNPEHISSYSLILEEGTPFGEQYQNYYTEELEELDRKMYSLTNEVLKAGGYHRYEISNYSKPGLESKHNCSYWLGIPYYGCGLGASSLIRIGDSYFRTSNVRDLDTYLAIDFASYDLRSPLHAEVEKNNLIARMEEFMFLGLRMTKGVRASEFARKFGYELEEVHGSSIRYLEKQGLLVQEGDRVYLTERGLDLSDYCFVYFVIDDWQGGRL